MSDPAHIINSAWAALCARCPIYPDIEGWIAPGEAALLYHLAECVPPDSCIVEVGSYRGKSTVALALGATPPVEVWAFDPHTAAVGVSGGKYGPVDRLHFNRTLERTMTIGRVRPMACDSQMVARGWSIPISLCFIDGDHSAEGVQRDLDAWLPHIPPKGCLVLDDIDLPGPRAAFDRLLASGKWGQATRIGKMGAMVRLMPAAAVATVAPAPVAAPVTAAAPAPAPAPVVTGSK